MLHDILRTETTQAHEAIEGVVKFDAITTSSQSYLSLLETFYGFYLPVEKGLLQFEEDFNKLGLKLRSRLKQDLLQDDLSLMGNKKEIDYCDPKPLMSSVYEALGVLYVLEGSTLGGQVIHKHLMMKNDFSQRSELKFHAGYGKDTLKMWSEFKDVLNSVPVAHHNEVIRGANNLK